MWPNDGQPANWEDAQAYVPLLEADRSIFAWEWLRRVPGYRAAAARSGAGRQDVSRTAIVADERAARWGLHAFEQPERAGSDARPIWRREIHPSVLAARAVDEGDPEDRFDLARLRDCATVVRSRSGAEHVLLSERGQRLRLDIVSGTVCDGPVLLRFDLSGMRSLVRPLVTLRQLVALWRAGRFSRALHPPDVRAARWILLLRTHDALTAGADQRRIAECLLDRDAAGRRWRVQAPALRSRVQRLVREARRMAGGGYLTLLGGG